MEFSSPRRRILLDTKEGSFNVIMMSAVMSWLDQKRNGLFSAGTESLKEQSR